MKFNWNGDIKMGGDLLVKGEKVDFSSFLDKEELTKYYSKEEIDTMFSNIGDTFVSADAELNMTSENAVQNKVITQQFNNIETRVNDIDGELSALQSTVQTNTTNIGIHENEIAVLTTNVSDIQTGLSVTAERVNEVEDNFTPFASCYFILGYGGYINFDTINRVVTIPRDTVLISNKIAKSVNFNSEVTIDFSVISSTAIKIVYYISTGTFEVLKYNATIENPSDTIVICAFRTDTNGTFSYAISINAPYSIDGVPYNINATASDITPKVMLNNNIKSVNHRGYGTAPENTLAAYRLSKINGFEYVETDISFTSDNVAVCLHDNTIDRTSNGSGNISDLTFDEVRTYDFGSWKSSDYAGEKIPSFEEFILLCRNLGLSPYIELKSGTQEQIEACIDIVEKYGMRGKVTWISFSSTCLTYVKNYDNEARLGYVANAIDETIIDRTLSLLTDTNEVFVDTNYTTLTDENCNMCAEANLPLEVWTVNTKSAITSLNPYVSGVTSNTLIASHILMLNSLGVEELNTDEPLYIDTDLDTASTNPVQNKAIATEIASLKTDIVDVQNNTAVNLFKPNLSYSSNGITTTVNEDGTFTIDGTATADVTDHYISKTASIEGKGKYLHVFLLSGTVPDNFSGVNAFDSNYLYGNPAYINAPASMGDATYMYFKPRIFSGDTFVNARLGIVVTDTIVESYIPYIADGNTISEKIDNAVTTLQSQIDTNMSNIEDIQTELTQTTTKATEVYKAMPTINGNISSLQAEVDGLTASVDYMSEYKADTTTVNGIISNVSALTERVKTNEINISSNTSDITAMQASITKLQDNNVQISKDISSISATATIAQSRADAAFSNAEINTTEIEELKKRTAVNLFMPNTSLSYSASGITMTINSDGTFILNGTATATITNCMLHKTTSISGQGKYLHVFLLSGTAPDDFSGVIAMNSSYGYVCNATLGNPAKMNDTATYAVFRPKIISGDTFTNAKFGVVVTDTILDNYIGYIAEGNTICEKLTNYIASLS